MKISESHVVQREYWMCKSVIESEKFKGVENAAEPKWLIYRNGDF